MSCFSFETQRFGNWILSPSSGKTYSVGSNRDRDSPKRRILKEKQDILDKDKTMNSVQKRNICPILCIYDYETEKEAVAKQRAVEPLVNK
jgi:hypothetical protein